MSVPIASDPITTDRDVVAARLRAFRLASQLGFDAADQTRIATAVSEVARNALVHGGRGIVSFDIDHDTSPASFRVIISDNGPGIPDLEGLLSGGSRGHGLTSARRLVDHFSINSTVGRGTAVRLGKTLPRGNGFTQAQLAELRRVAETASGTDPVQVLQRQNGELLAALAEVRARQEELAYLNQELEDTNRGVVALHAELEEQAERLRRASELKTRFLSNMSHEFRTPLSSILALTRLLLDHVDGPLQGEQVKQVTYIRQSAQELLELINDLLDLAKVEAGRLTARPTSFVIADLFGSLRGILKPLQVRENVILTIEDPIGVPPLLTDEAKVAQILRNFIANALRFTKRGTIDVKAAYHADRDFFEFSVSDTGIGIAQVDQTVIFQEFEQVDTPLQSETRGTGLGLPLSRRLAELLGGYILLESDVGVGSTFSLWIPRRLEGAKDPGEVDAQTRRLLVIDDEDKFRYIVRQMIGEHAGLEIVEAKSAIEGLAKARHTRPDAIILDLLMPGMSGQDALRSIRHDLNLEQVPVFIFTSLPLTERLRGELSGATGVVAKQELSKDTLRNILGAVLRLGEPM
jgi:signal transduction histidine kinase